MADTNHMCLLTLVIFITCLDSSNSLTSLCDGSVDIISLNESQYCFVNQNTIRVSDNFTSELQDIVNKTEHFIISTTINSTVIFIAPSNGSRCSLDDDNLGVPTEVYVVMGALHILTMLIAVTNFILHLMIKELRTVSGILIMMLCGTMAMLTIVAFTSLTYGYVAQKEQINSVCTAFVNLAYYLVFVYEAEKLGVLFQFTYLMYKSCRMISSENAENKLCILIKYSAFVLVTSIACLVIVILFELAATGSVYSGPFCANINGNVGGDDEALFFGIAVIVVIVFVASELAMFSVGLVLCFLNNKTKCCKTMSVNFRVAIALATTVGITMILIVSLSEARITGKLLLYITAGSALIEQLVLFIVFLSSNKAWTKTRDVGVTLSRPLSKLSRWF